LDSLSGGLSRRDFLKRVSIGAVGAGLMASGLSMLEKKTLAQIKCYDVSVVCKRILAKVEGFGCTVCEYYGQRISKVTLDLKGEILSVEPCDESAGIIPERSILEAYEVEHYFRLNGPCEKPVGTFRSLATVRLRHPSGGILAESNTVGAMRGTIGFNPRQDRCCDFPWGIGTLELEGYKGSGLEDCLLQAIFQVKLEIEPQQLYEGKPWEVWNADLDGTIIRAF